MNRALAVLRPEPGNAATAGRIEALGLRAIRLPLFAVQPVDWTPPDAAAHDALLLTSANAIRFGGEGLAAILHLPVLAVGTQTAEIARAAGFDVMAVGDSDAAALIALAEARGIKRALHLAGRDRSIDAGGPVSSVITVYASEAVAISAAQLSTLEGSTALLHSMRAAKRLATLTAGPDIQRSIGIAALSPAIATAAGTGWEWSAIAPAPTDTALIDAARARD